MTREEKAQLCMDNPRHSPAFQFYPDNWWGSRHVAAMSIEQRGIHSSLIFSAWLENNCGIPENEVCLSARIPDSLKDSAFKVLEWCWFFYNGFWFCERLLNERIKQINLSKIRILSGSEGGRPLKSKINKSKPIDNQLDSKQKPNHNQTITNSEEEDVIENENENTNAIKDENSILEAFIPVYLKEAFQAFEEMRRSIKKPISKKARKLIVDKLEKLYPKNIEKQIECLNQSTMNCWQGIFEIKKEGNEKPRYGYQEVSNEFLADQAKTFLERHKNDDA